VRVRRSVLVVALALLTLPIPSAGASGGGSTAQSDVAAQAATAEYAYALDRRGTTHADYAEFQRVVRATLDDRRGWWRAGVSFAQDPARARLTIVLASPSVVASASSVCSAAYSCRVGNTVYVNDERWRTGSRPWRDTLARYRQYVVNHEVGHWLGMGHSGCPSAGALAPVMQQQSISMQGCRENAWPVRSEVERVAARHGTQVRSRTDFVAVTGTDGAAWARWAVDPDWFPWGGQLVEAPAVVQGPAEFYLLGVGRDGNVWIRTDDAGWWPFGHDGTRCSGASAAAVAGQLVVACRGGDDALWVTTAALPARDDAPLPAGRHWRSLGGALQHGVAVAAFRGEGETGFRARYTAVGEDDRPWSRTDAQDWQLLSDHRCGGTIATAAYFQALACRDLGSPALRVWHFPSGTVGALLGGIVTGRPAVTVDATGVADYYALGTDRGVWAARQTADGAVDRFRPFGGEGRHGVAATFGG
jgi:hypothetical protein